MRLKLSLIGQTPFESGSHRRAGIAGHEPYVFASDGKSLSCYDIATHELVWRRSEMQGVLLPQAVDGQTLWIREAFTTHALRIGSGETIWTSPLPVEQMTVGKHHLLLAGIENNSAYAACVEKFHGVPIWHLPLDLAVQQSRLAGDRVTLLLGNEVSSQKLLFIEAATGLLHRELSVSDIFASSNCLGAPSAKDLSAVSLLFCTTNVACLAARGAGILIVDVALGQPIHFFPLAGAGSFGVAYTADHMATFFTEEFLGGAHVRMYRFGPRYSDLSQIYDDKPHPGGCLAYDAGEFIACTNGRDLALINRTDGELSARYSAELPDESFERRVAIVGNTLAALSADRRALNWYKMEAQCE